MFFSLLTHDQATCLVISSSYYRHVLLTRSNRSFQKQFVVLVVYLETRDEQTIKR